MNRYSSKTKEQIISPKKVYAIDTGLVDVIGFKISENLGPFLENLVFLSLKRSGYDIFYAIVNDSEIDFLVLDNNEIRGLINVTYSMEEERTRKREVNSLVKGMKAFGARNAYIITWKEAEIIRIGNKRIMVIPAYKWVLNQDRYI